MTAESQSTADERITKNLEQTGRLLNEIVEDPDILDEIPDGAMVVLLPVDDPKGVEQNIEGARRACNAGRIVHVRTMRSAARIPLKKRVGWPRASSGPYNERAMERPE